MKNEIKDWTEENIISFVENHIVESIVLEFKACDALRPVPKRDWRKEFAKDVSAFANSAGGILIYGVIENRETHEAESLDSGFDPLELNVEALEQIINSRIQRRIEGIIFKSIPLSGNNAGRFIYVLEIPESNHSPHMANFRFYKRYNFESVYMEEHDVRERYRRETFPGKDIVEAWRDDAINPMIDVLEGEAGLLRLNAWTWNRRDQVFKGLNPMFNPSEFSANKDDFIDRYSQVRDRLREHDALLLEVVEAGRVLFEKVSQSSFIQETFRATTSEEALEAIEAANPNTFRASSTSVSLMSYLVTTAIHRTH